MKNESVEKSPSALDSLSAHEGLATELSFQPDFKLRAQTEAPMPFGIFQAPLS
jgi:hypothetical protein